MSPEPEASLSYAAAPTVTDTPRAFFSVKRALLASGGSRLVSLPLTGLANLALARLITHAVGIQQFGIVMLVATLSQFLPFADLGAGAAVATVRARVSDDPATVEALRRTTLTALRTMLASAGVLAAIAIGAGAAGLWPTVLGIESVGTGSSVDWATVAALLAFCASLPFAVGEALLRGGGRLHEAILLLALSAPCALAVAGVLYLVRAQPLAYALAIPIGGLLALVGCGSRAWVGLRRELGGLLRKVFRLHRFPGTRILSTAAPMFVVMIGLPLALQSDRVVLAHRVDTTTLSNYSYAAQLYAPLWSVISLAAMALWPAFASSGIARERLRHGWLTGMSILGSAGLAIALGFLVMAGYVIAWMSAGEASPTWLLLGSFACLLFVQSLHVTTGILLISPRHLTFQACCVVALVLTNFPLSWFLAPRLGAAGPVVASALTVTVCQLIPGLLLALRVTSTRPVKTRTVWRQTRG